MAVRPKTGEDTLGINRGTGALGTGLEYLQADPTSYYYTKFKSQDSKYLDDRMWTEAARRGELDSLVGLLSQRSAADSKAADTKVEDVDTTQPTEQDYFDKWKSYEGYNNDYDSYMLALSIPNLDNTTKKDRITTLEDGTEYNFGSYTDQEWAKSVLDSTFQKYDAQIIEENKSTMNFFQRLGAAIGSGTEHVAAGVGNFVADIYNITEGIVNIFANWGNDADWAQRFLYAFSNDDTDLVSGLRGGIQWLQQTAYELERDFTHVVDAVKAYDNPESNGYTTWGKWATSALESLGYMLPSMVAGTFLPKTAGLTVASEAYNMATSGSMIFYAGVFSGNVKDTVERAANNGLTYKDLAAGEVLANSAIKAAAQYGVEVLLGKIIGFSGLDKMRGLEGSAKAGVAIGTNEFAAAGIAAARGLKSMAKEGLEETLQDLSDGLIDFFYSKGSAGLSEVYAGRNEEITLQSLFDSFIVGALMEGVTSSVNNLKYITPSQRAYGTDVSGKSYQLGTFQSMNFVESMQTLNEWNDTLNDPGAKLEDRQNAALKMSVAMDTLGSVLKDMGQDRALKANNILVGYLKSEAKKEEIKKLSNAGYAQSLYNKFEQYYGKAQLTYIGTPIKERILRGIGAYKEEFIENNVSEINNVITEKTASADPEVSIPKDNVDTIKSLLKELGVVAFVGTDGNLVKKADQIVYVPNEYLQTGDIKAIVSSLAYSVVKDKVYNSLSKSQINMIVNYYNKLSPNKGTIADAIQALLFDKTFYTKVLLLSEEKHYRNEAFKILSTLDTIIEETIDSNQLDEKASAKLLEKVRDTMRTGLYNYATQYCKVDFNNVSLKAVPQELRDAIAKNKNVIFTQDIDNGIEKAKQKKTATPDEILRFNKYLNSHLNLFTTEQLSKLRQEITSKNYNDVFDAWASLQLASIQMKDSTDTANTSKLIYLTAPENSLSLTEKGYIKALEQYLGTTQQELANGQFNIEKASNEAKEVIFQKYDLDDAVSRLAFLRESLFNISNGTMTIGADYNYLRLIEKSKFVQDKYLTEDGDATFRKDLIDGKIKFVKDIIKDVSIGDLANIEIRYDAKTTMSSYLDGSSYITLGNTNNIINSCMHELTHAAQYLVYENISTKKDKNKTIVSGGSSNMFKGIPLDTANNINKYMYDNFPVAYSLLREQSNIQVFSDVLYFLLEGELQARSSLDVFIPNIGFTIKGDKKTLVSPDGKSTWSLELATILKSKVESPVVIGKEIKGKTTIKEDFKNIDITNTADLIAYGDSDKELKASKPENTVGKDVINKYNVSPEEARDYVYKLFKVSKDIIATNDYNKIAKAINDGGLKELDKNKLSKEQRTKLNAGIMYVKGMKSYNKQMKAWLDSVKEKVITDKNISYDVPLFTEDVEQLPDKTLNKILDFTKDSDIKSENGTPIMFYRGNVNTTRFKGKVKETSTDYQVSYWATNPFVSTDYAKGGYDDTGLYIPAGIYKTAVTNLKYEDLYIINAKNQNYDDIVIDGVHKTSDEIVREVIKNNTDNKYKGVLIKNVNEMERNHESYLTDDLVVFNNDYMLNISDEDNGKFLNDFFMMESEYGMYQNKDFFKSFVKRYNTSAMQSEIDLTRNDIIIKNIRDYLMGKISKALFYRETMDQAKITKSQLDEAFKKYVGLGTSYDVELEVPEFKKGTFKRDEDTTKLPKHSEIADKISQLKKEYGETKSKATKLEYQRLEKSLKEKQAYYRARRIKADIAKGTILETFSKNEKLMNPNVQQFYLFADRNIDKLDAGMKKLIKKSVDRLSPLTDYDFIEYVGTASNMGDTTFKAIAKYIFNNEELAKLTFKEFTEFIDRTQDFAMLSYLYPNEVNKQKSLKELEDLFKQADKFDQKTLDKVQKRVTTVLVDNGEATVPVQSSIDTTQANLLYFNHFDGTLKSIRDINNIGKYNSLKQEGSKYIENTTTGELESLDGSNKNAVAESSYQKQLRKATIDYTLDDRVIDDDLSKTLDSIDFEEKLNLVNEKYTEIVTNKTLKEFGVNDITELSKEQYATLKARIKKSNQVISNMSEESINNNYLKIMANKQKSAFKVSKEDLLVSKEQIAKHEKHLASNRVRNALNKLITYIGSSNKKYESIPSDLQKYIVKEDNKYSRNSEAYFNLDTKALTELADKLYLENRKHTKAAEKAKLEEKIYEGFEEKVQKKAKEIAKEQLKNFKPNGKETTEDKRTRKEKIHYEYKTKIKTQTFEFVSGVKPNETITKLLDTAWNDKRMSEVQGITGNKEQDIASTKTFFEVNNDTLLAQSLGEVEDTIKWFTDTRMNNVTDAEFRKFQTIKLLYLEWVNSQVGKGGLFEDINSNLKQKIDNTVQTMLSTSATLMSVHNQVLKNLNPFDYMVNASMELDGVELPKEIKQQLFDAMKSNDFNVIKKAQQTIIDYANTHKKSKVSILRKITSVRSMSMLSSPITWLRNKVSNMALKRINKLSSAIGNRLFTGKHITSLKQVKMTGKVTVEIQNFIDNNFINNKFFDNFISDMSKYNPSQLNESLAKVNKAGQSEFTKENILAQIVLKSMYSKYYSENMFKNKFVNQVHQKLMKVMSDDAYVREATIRYLGKTIAEKGYDISDGKVTDAIMNDLANSLGLAMRDYMHSDNFFNHFEQTISKINGPVGEVALFAYKTLLPFAGASWNWFKAAINLSPLGLGRAIYNITHLEQKLARVEADYAQGKSQLAPSLVEYMTRRDLGQGVIGSIAWGLGMLLAGVGFIRLDDDDYGTPKLRIGNVSIDVSSIFGTSSLLAGAALINGIKDEKSLLTGLNNMVDVIYDGLPLMQIVEMDMYSNGGFSMSVDQLESIALSFVPNIVSWIAGGTYTGNLKKSSFLDKAFAKIPFLANIVPKKVNPYTGSEGSAWDIFNRVVPYFSYDAASINEQKSTALGLNKTMLKGKYSIEGKDFSVSGKTLTEINKAYGQLNAEDLEKFYNNKMSVRIKVNNTYKTLTYNQMNDEQRKTAVNSIMSNNSEVAKVIAWTSKGNKYYGSSEIISKLRKVGYTTNVYKGTKGFVESK